MMNKKGFEVSFAWLFAILVGAVILILTIYGITKYVQTEQTILNAKTGEEIGVLLNPLETSFESAKSVSLTLPVDSRIYNRCDNLGEFGHQKIPISQKSFGKWTETDVEASFYNKYIFSKEYVEGKEFLIFSKPFEAGFKVADLIYLTSSNDKYCFIGAPTEIKEELENINQENFFVDNCTANMTRVCFADSSCEVYVDYSNGYVQKEDRMYFASDALMYAGIFSNANIYECEVKRLAQRVVKLATIYRDKANFVAQVGCNSDLNLDALISMAENVEDSRDMISLVNFAEEIGDKNDRNYNCKLW